MMSMYMYTDHDDTLRPWVEGYRRDLTKLVAEITSFNEIGSVA